MISEKYIIKAKKLYYKNHDTLETLKYLSEHLKDLQDYEILTIFREIQRNEK